MARIELRDVTIYIMDGLSGNAATTSNHNANDTTLNINTVVLNTDTTNLVPVGARFTIAGEDSSTVHTVTARTPSGTGPTTNITFTPALGTGNYDSANVVTFQSQRIEIKIGEGNLTWSETKEYEYLRDRGDLDTVKEGDEQPVSVSLEFIYEFVKSESGGVITPVDALKRAGEAAEWVSTSDDLCEPYCVDILAKHCVPCGTYQDEDVLFEEFRHESLDYDMGEASIAVSGMCNKSEATVSRSTDSEC